MKRLWIYAIVITLASCGTTNQSYYASRTWSKLVPPTDEKPVETLYLVGDAGKLDGTSNHVIEAVKRSIQKEGKTTLVYLGDNVYTYGLPKKSSAQRSEKESILNAQLEVAPYVNGSTYFIPGNHDWNNGSPGGLKRVQAQEKYIESYFAKDKKVKMYPSRGCGDPKVVKVHKDLVYVFVDTQWWLQDWEKEPTINHGCDVESRDDFLNRMNEIFLDYKNDEIVLMMHHPTKSNGHHGGKFSLKDHIFPLTMLNKDLYIPLPIVGSLYPLYRQVAGSSQDIQNELNKRLMNSLKDMAASAAANVIFVSGHEHSLQLFEDKKQIQIISGSGAKRTYAQKGGGATYVRDARGYAKIDFYPNNEAWVEFYTVDDHNSEGKLDFRKQLRTPRAGTEETDDIYPELDEEANQITVAADPNKKAGSLKKTFMGEQYRDIWTTPVDIPIIDLSKAKGGLTPVKKGGGMSSNSLRLQAKDGKQYILRSVNKVFTRALPDNFKNLRLVDIIKDQNSAYHPYGSLVVANLSKAAGVYYTDPQVVFLKRQPALGSYNKYFPEEVYMFEQRPNGDWSDSELFGSSKKIISYNDLLVKLREKKNHFIDQKWVLKSRMFDLFIHDWDRHDDQWRWASFKRDGRTIYRPIPRDRDLAFYKFVGAVPWFISQTVMTKYKTMKDDVKDVKSLSLNGKTFDRYFMNELEWKEWKPIIQQLQEDITDEDILSSGKDLPKEVKRISDKELNSKLIARRNNLMKIGKRFYDLLAKEVEITGTDNKEIFDIDNHPDGSVTVSYDIVSKKGRIRKYDRTFYPNETEEVRLYGLRGDDIFNVSGSNTKIRVRIIGGEGDDMIYNHSSSKNVYAYDNPQGIKLVGTIKDKTSNHPSVNKYDRYGFMYDATMIMPQFHYNRDGFWLGATYTKIDNGWRGDPYRNKHSVRFITAPAGQDAYRVDYYGHIPDMIGNIDFMPYVNVDFPLNNNFFGFGNETTDNSSNRNYNWVRMNQINVLPYLSVVKGAAKISFGPEFDSYYVYNRDNRIINESRYAQEEFYKRKYFGGVTAEIDFHSVDNDHHPTSGLKINTNIKYLQQFSGSRDHLKMGAELQFYLPLSSNPQIVLANQIGYHWMSGDAYFYQMPSLGNRSGIRGLRANRFVGHRSFYENVDLRIKLLSWNNVILPMDIGVIGGYDIGRVWYKGESSDKWHHAETVGLYFDLLGMFIIQPFYSFTEDGNQFSIRTRFSF